MKSNKTAYEAALHLLKYRLQSSYELTQKLKVRKYSEDDIRQAIEKLEYYGYVNDESLAEDLFNKYKEMNAYGDLYVHRKLKKMGLHFDDHLTFEDELQAAMYVMKSKLSLVPAVQKNYARAAGILARRGFRYSVVQTVLSTLNIHDRED